jgi:thioesterase domain-containing protein/acyl carrier protein
MIPSAFVMLEALPLTPNGKLDRQALPAPDQARPELDKHFIAPRDAIELQLAQIWEEVLEIRPIGVRDNFFDLGGHSLLAVHLVALIKKRLDKDVQIAAFFQQPTIEQLVSVLRLGSEPTRQSSLVSIQPRGSRRPFFLVHPVEGTVVCYANLARHLGADQPVYGLQAKGLEEGQGSQRSIEEMADHYIKAVRTVQAEDPYILGGWSLGGIVAFEMAQQLRTQGHEVAMLFVLDSWARPPILESTEENRTALLDVLSDHLGFSLKNINFSLDHLLAITPEEQVNYVMEQAIAYKLVPAGLGEARIDHYLQVYKQNLQALQSYVPRAYSGTVILFKASEQFAVTQKDSEMGWGDLVQRLLVHVVPGNHYSILREPHVQILAQRLRTLLQDAEAHERGRSPLTFQISS